MTIVLLCPLSFIRLSSVLEEILPFDCLNFNVFPVLSHNYIGDQGLGFHETY